MASTGLVVHHLNNSRSQRVLWLLEELGLEYKIQKYERNKQSMRAPKELREVHPLGKAPILTDDGVVIAESGNIIEYIVDKFGRGRLKPREGTPEHLQYKFWMHHAEGSAMTPNLLALLFGKVATDSPFFIRPLAALISGGVFKSFITPELNLERDFVNGELSKREWLTGAEFTAADIQMSFPLEMGASRGEGNLAETAPKIKAFLDKIHAMDSYKRAQEKSGMPYTLKY